MGFHMRNKLLLTASLLTMLSFNNASASECGDVTIADMNWTSASLIAHIDQFVLTHGYDCKVEMVPGGTEAIGASMIEKGEPDIAPELWANAMKEALDKGVEEKRLRYASNSLSDGGEEGFWIPKYLVDENPEMATIEGVIKNAKLFEHPEDKEKSAFFGCPAGWNCQISSGHLFDALKLGDANFDLVDPGSAAGLDGSIARAFERKKPWFGYYWSPTAILGKYEMVKVDFGSGVDKDEFLNCTSKKDCAEPKVTMYPPALVTTVTTESFATRAPEAFKYLESRSFTNADMNIVLAWMEENQADGEVAMEHYLTKNEADWTAWVSEDVAAKVKKALKSL